MYKKNQNHQFSLGDFNQRMGLKLDPENKWIKKAAMIPWDEIEAVYADLFPSDCGMPAKPLHMALWALLIQIMSYGYYPDKHQMERIAVIDKVYEQQEYMYKNNVHTVQDRIVSISQPYVRPIVMVLD